MAGVIVCLCYIGITTHSNITAFNTHAPTQPDKEELGGHWLTYKQRESPFSAHPQKWRQTSLYEIFDKHQSQTSENCNNFCDVDKDLGCAATSFQDWKYAVKSPELKFKPLLANFEYIYPFEVDYLSQPPMTDSKQLPSLILSKVYIEGTSSGEVVCAIGGTLKGRVDLVDGYGKQRTLGGDEVRVWVVDKKTKKYRAAGHVIDLRNGSYQISIRCLWPGKSQLNVAVAYPREFLRAVIQQTHLAVTWLVVARFKRRNIEEVTMCSATPNVPGRHCICNFTSVNGLSFYCGRPVDSRLTCADWVEVGSPDAPIPHNVTDAERDLIAKIPKKVANNVIHHNITIVSSDTGRLPKLKPCTETDLASTWEVERPPHGYWTPGKNWQSLICERPQMTPEWTVSCLKNSVFWIFGDSNGIRLFNVLSNLTKQGTVQRIPLMFSKLEFPVYHGSQWRQRLSHECISRLVDQIPSNGTHFLVIHYYLHIAPTHLSVVYLRLKAAHDAVQRLINRNPNVVVGIRGPHVTSVDHERNHAVGGDNLGAFWLEMIQYVFADLRSKVVFLDGWEMTIALENPSYHPHDCVPQQLLRTLLAFRCS
ncbi:hypothetical protein BsWGS_28962 [Bradybaena similaris]